MSQTVEQARLVTTQAAIIPGQAVTELALFTASGTPVTLPVNATTTVAGLVKKMPAQADSTAVDVAALNVQFNLLLAKLRTAGILS